MKIGTAPASITVFVCMDVPDAMLVSAHAASNCRGTRCHRKKYNFEHFHSELKTFMYLSKEQKNCRILMESWVNKWSFPF